MGYNVAIVHHIVDSSLKPFITGGCTMNKKGIHKIVDNETICAIDDETIPFIMKTIASEHHVGSGNIKNELNGN